MSHEPRLRPSRRAVSGSARHTLVHAALTEGPDALRPIIAPRRLGVGRPPLRAARPADDQGRRTGLSSGSSAANASVRSARWYTM